MAEHPITPPPELRRLWAQQAQRMDPHDPVAWMQHVSAQAARWGADQELGACCAWLIANDNPRWALALQEGRRPKPPSPKEEALKVLEALIEWQRIDDPEYQALRHALEQLDD